jgi:hypothetical protein
MNSTHRVPPTAESLRRPKARRRQSREAVLHEMRDRGAALHLHYGPDGRIWFLSSGARVRHTTAQDIIADRRVVGVGDALFEGHLAQTYRWIGSEEEITS